MAREAAKKLGGYLCLRCGFRIRSPRKLLASLGGGLVAALHER
jgi:hypothetical protein